MIHIREIPPLPKYDPIIIDDFLKYGRGSEIERCPTCGALQRIAYGDINNKEARCARCYALLHFENKDILIADWNNYWLHTPYYDEPYLIYDKSEFSDKVFGIVSIPSTLQFNVGENKDIQISIIGVTGYFKKNINMTKNCYFEIQDGYEDKIFINNDGLLSINKILEPCQIEIYARYNSFIDVIKVIVS
jgi:hypothetical protein